MGLIKAQKEHMQKQREVYAGNVADSLVNQLAPADGLVHVAMFNCFGSLGATQVISSDEKFNQQADQIITSIQRAGREIVNVKFDGQYGAGVTSNGISYHVLVLYK